MVDESTKQNGTLKEGSAEQQSNAQDCGKASSRECSTCAQEAPSCVSGGSASADAGASGAAAGGGDAPSVSGVARTRNLCIACAAALVAVLLAMQTISFVARSTDAHNMVVFGGVGVEVVETTIDASNAEVVVPDGANEDISNDDTCSRIVRVRNTQDHPVFTRVSLSMTGTDTQGTSVPADDVVSYEFGDGSWKAGGDGWYYYDAVLEPGQTTPPLITGLVFDMQQVHDRYRGGTLKLDINAVGVQSENNAASALDAEGWPQGGN